MQRKHFAIAPIVARPHRLCKLPSSSYTGGVFEQKVDQETLPGIIGEDPSVMEHLDGRGSSFSDLDLRGRHLRWVAFSGATFRNCDFRDTTWDCVFADFAVFEDCHFDMSHLMDSVFAGSRLTRCTFTGATADMCNFNAIAARETDFSDCSLRRSRFINARLRDVRFANCDLKDALFQFSERQEVSFKFSNHEEACF